ncbi:MAG: hypothetical protein QW407_04865 [Thermofilaceae archaeon]
MKTKSLEGKRTELVYWEQNGETWTAAKTWEQVKQLIKNGEACANWKEGETPQGYWNATLYVTVEGVIIVKEWTPKPGYRWSEIQVWKLNIG